MAIDMYLLEMINHLTRTATPEAGKPRIPKFFGTGSDELAVWKLESFRWEILHFDIFTRSPFCESRVLLLSLFRRYCWVSF